MIETPVLPRNSLAEAIPGVPPINEPTIMASLSSPKRRVHNVLTLPFSTLVFDFLTENFRIQVI